MSVESKSISILEPPARRAGRGPRLAGRELVNRERNVARCLAANAPLVLLYAPAGYGKTTVLLQWEEADPRPFQWISIDWRHNDPAVMLGSVAAALDELEPLPNDVLAPFAAPIPNIDLVGSRICDALGERSQALVIVLDDLHLLDNPDSIRPLGPIIEAMPAGSALAVATRDELALPVGRLRGRGMLVELGAAELVMTGREASELLASGGLELELDLEQVELLVGRTEGWAAGLYLAGQALAGAADLDAGLEEFRGSDHAVADYLRDEFLSGLAESDLDFLSRASVLDRLSAPVCDAVLDRTDSARILSRLARSNLLLIPLDRRQHEYRYHALLREMLASELHQLDATEVSQLHSRASRWYASAGDYDRAVPHAIASGDIDGAANLIWERTAEYHSKGRAATVRQWLDAFTEPQLRVSALLCVANAASYLNVGDGAAVEHWTSAALSAAGEDSGKARAAAKLIRAAGAARDGVIPMGEDVSQVVDLLPADSPWRSLCCLLSGVSRHLAGDPASAGELLEEGARRGRIAAPSVETVCRAQLALLELDQGEIDSAGANLCRAIEVSDHYGLSERPTQGLVLAASALVQAQLGRTEAAVRDLRLSERMVGALNDFSPWYEAEVRIVLARALLLLDDIGAARSHLGEAGRYLHQAPDAETLKRWLQEAWNDADAARAVTGRWPLTPAELRLLHRLPTHLSFRGIAEELFVSPNTVKTQARSIYRKLGVASRAEAVACAKTAGLLEPGHGARLAAE